MQYVKNLIKLLFGYSLTAIDVSYSLPLYLVSSIDDDLPADALSVMLLVNV
jgi:hypothetical protein